MPEHICSITINALLDHLQNGTPLSAAVEDELRRCGDCSALIRRAQHLGALLDSPLVVDTDTTALAQSAESEVVRRRRRGLLISAAAVFIVSIAFAIAFTRTTPLHHPVAVAIALSMLFGGPMLLVMATIRSFSPGKLYKRLEGRELSGVCRGLSEATGVPVWVLRMAFVALIFAKGAGLILYLLLDLIMPIHPADRGNLLRFRIARWWRGRAAA
ncbi:MAG TPA: PspC domain-containing protein [Thermoanaerobaculia bacterium]|nr:PspC domain-containing protein [Thermoanaerobaculia bacterium]